MKNKEKRQYMTDLIKFQSPRYLAEFDNRRKFLKKTPTCLYKYRRFDKYSFEMIDENYVFLAPVKGLDDPFDCLSDFTINDFYNEQAQRITPKAINFIVDQVYPHGNQNLSPKELKALALQCINGQGVDYKDLPKTVISNGAVTTCQIDPLFIALENFNNNFENIIESLVSEGLVKTAMSPGDKVGICSLSEKRDNKVMWSLYGKNYEGYCIEYEIPKRKEITPNLYPVIYTRRNNNRFIEKAIEYAMGVFMRDITFGQQTGNLGAYMELFCTKDTDWSYQAEWRLIANAGGKCKYLNIKAIYLGFKVKDSNQKMMERLAKKKGFALYKMNPPDGKTNITYAKIH